MAFPTETVYGLGANALQPAAVAKIFAAKGRPAWNPVIVHVADTDAAKKLVSNWPERAARIAAACWPGPLTLVLGKSDKVPDIVTAGAKTVAVRVPSHVAALELLRAADVPIAAPSANRFAAISPTTAKHVEAGLGNRVPLILDGGACEVGIESTVLDLSGETPVILRPGGISADTLSHLLGEQVPVRRSEVDNTTGEPVDADTAPRSPGSAIRHYAPNADVWLAPRSDEGEIQQALIDLTVDPGARVGMIAIEGGLSLNGVHRTIRLPAIAGGFARGLYAALHTLDADGCTVIIIESPPEESVWDAVRDRVVRATR